MTSPKQLFIWTASHLTNANRIKYLLHMMASVKKATKDLQIHHYISLSIDMEFDLPNLNYPGTLFLGSHRLDLSTEHKICPNLRQTQFQHLTNIYIQTMGQFQPDDMILLIDDDDLLLHLPSELFTADVIKGYLFVPENDPNPETTLEQALNPENQAKWSKYNDFSGYIVKYKHLAKYFDERKGINHMLEDIAFMKFADNIPGAVLPNDPFVYHRLITDESRWRGEISDMLSIFQKIL